MYSSLDPGGILGRVLDQGFCAMRKASTFGWVAFAQIELHSLLDETRKRLFINIIQAGELYMPHFLPAALKNSSLAAGLFAPRESEIYRILKGFDIGKWTTARVDRLSPFNRFFRLWSSLQHDLAHA